ncbi:CPBP family intramembrane glutamic endopeptidase [Parapedobacter tibetensis]|uniref:CPBP family intramembrane glutamic endopeptidase n=1 Tax=Parapedobacter tibetensis TaxID=2972951 RepID=UPI00214D899E|nr:type II CAAX endopeptidase family protein [Parapedobacter tibetensis]
MKESTYTFPNIIQSLALLLIWFFVLHPISKLPFSFIENESLVSLLSEVLKLFVLLVFARVLVKYEYLGQSLFKVRKLNVNIVFLICLGVLCIKSLPSPFLSFFDEHDVYKMLIEPMASEVNVYYFVFSCIIVPISEEILFRGIVLNGLIRRYSFIVALLLSSILFGLLHVSIVGAFLFSCFVGWIYYRSNNLLYCIVAHAIGNTISFFFKYGFVKQYISMEAFSGFIDKHAVIIGISSVSVLVVCLYAMAMLFKKRGCI